MPVHVEASNEKPLPINNPPLGSLALPLPMNTRSTAPGCHPDAAAVAPAGRAEPNPASPEEATAADNGGDKVVPVVPRAGCNQAPTALAGASVAAAVAGCEDVVAAPADPPAFGAAGDAADGAGLPTEAMTAVRRPRPPAEDDAALPAGDGPAPGRVAREGTEGRPGPALTDGPDSRDPLSAHATAGRTTIPTPTPNATARAPTRPTDRASHTGGDCRAGRDSAQPTGGILTTTARRPSREHSGARIPPARQIAFDHQLTRTSGNLPPVGYPGPTRRHRNHGLRRHHSTYP